MSSTHTADIFIHYENDDDNTYEYYKQIENAAYFLPIQSIRNFGNFRIHGKYVSTFQSGRKFPNEYYCQPKEAMILRSGRKLNYINENFLWQDVNKIIQEFDGTPDARCLSIKKVIWLYENYHYLLSTCYEVINLYEMTMTKIKEFIYDLERSVPGVYQNIKFEKKTNPSTEEIYYELDHSVPMSRRDTDGKFVFCKCRYTVIKNEKTAIEREGHHVEEFLPQLKKLSTLYSRPHRIIIDSEAFKLVGQKTNDDCRRLVFSFLKYDHIKSN